MTAMATLDFPVKGEEVLLGGTMKVEGWAIFADRAADRVEVWVGDGPAVPVRRGLPRPDVVHAPATGFSGLAPVPRDLYEEGEVEVRVRAWSDLGESFTFDPVVVRLVDASPWGDADVVPCELPLPPPREREPGPLRICVVTHSMNLGGGELYLDELLGRLQGVEVLVISPANGPLVEQTRARGARVHLTDSYPIHPDHYEGAVHELALVMRSWGPDVVIANTVGVFAGVDAALRQGLPVIWAIHESFAIEEFITLNWGSRGLHDAIEHRMRHCLAHAHTVFEAQKTLELYQRQVPELQGRHIHYGIDLEAIAEFRAQADRAALRREHGFEEDDVVVLCMGVVQDRKAQLALTLAFERLAALHPRARLVLVGGHGSPYSLSVETLIVERDLGGRVDLLPIQPEVYPWYMIADAMVSASDVESLPRSILEAKAFGLPTLATDIFGLAEIITDGHNGWLCRPHSGAALVAGLHRVLSTPPDQRVAMSAACLAEAHRYDGSGYARSYLEFAASLADSRHTTEPPHPGDDQ